MIEKYEKMAEELGGRIIRGRLKKRYIEVDRIRVAKTCSRCKDMKILADFGKDNKSSDGKRADCFECSNARKRELHHRKRRKIATSTAYYENNREKIIKKTKKTKENMHKKMEVDPEYKQKVCESNRKSRKKWYEKNSEKLVVYRHSRRARIKSLRHDLTDEQREEIMCKFENKCALTGESQNLHFDHVIPLVTGHGGTTFENMIPLRGDLNYSKNDSNIFEWYHLNKNRFRIERTRFNALILWLSEINEMSVDEYVAYVYECHNNPRELVTPK